MRVQGHLLTERIINAWTWNLLDNAVDFCSLPDSEFQTSVHKLTVETSHVFLGYFCVCIVCTKGYCKRLLEPGMFCSLLL